jgi:DNA-binding GntR family transcriptional regulator
MSEAVWIEWIEAPTLTDKDASASGSDHAAILEAIRNQDALGARAAMQRHLSHLMTYLSRHG